MFIKSICETSEPGTAGLTVSRLFFHSEDFWFRAICVRCGCFVPHVCTESGNMLILKGSKATPSRSYGSHRDLSTLQLVEVL